MLINLFAFSDKMTSYVEEVRMLDVKYLNLGKAFAVSQNTISCKLKKDGQCVLLGGLSIDCMSVVRR